MKEFTCLYHDLMYQAYLKAQESPDPSTQNGAVLVQFQSNGTTKIIGSASNTFPPKVQSTEERLIRPLKYQFVEHAERGAIYDAAQKGHCTKGSTMFVPWAACDSCGRAIICAGVSKVVVHKPMMDKSCERWKDSIDMAFVMFKEAGIIVDYFYGKVGYIAVRFDGEIWYP